MGKHFHQFPALQLGKRAGFNDTYLIAYLGRGILVVSIELLALLDDLLELGVRNAGDVLHNDGLVHLGGSHHADARLAKAGLLGCFGLFGQWILKVLEYSVITGNPQLNLPGFTLNGKGAGKVLADGADSLVVFQLAGGLLEAEIEKFFTKAAHQSGKLLGGHSTKFFGGVLIGHGDE